jgi:hypothetical protein
VTGMTGMTGMTMVMGMELSIELGLPFPSQLGELVDHDFQSPSFRRRLEGHHHAWVYFCYLAHLGMLGFAFLVSREEMVMVMSIPFLPPPR